ncbi:MAG TPA: RnfABCDGE type electron transport complex subunit G [Geobacteraceae bacterium]|nr:RnfABCDGE type electron transport complex subunit G [Geobacteraceae bacterium]
MLDIFKLSIFLLVIAGIAGLGVGYVNSMTEPLIIKQALQAKINSFKEIYPQGEEVKDESAQYLKADTNPLIKEVNVAYIGGKPSGVIYLVEPKGYGGVIKILAGFDIAAKKVTAIKVLSQTETPGLGAKSKDSFFQDRYKDKIADTSLEVTKTRPTKDNQIQAITASTITSKAVTSGVNAARENFMCNFAK